MRGLWGLALVTGRGATASRQHFDKIVEKLGETRDENKKEEEDNENKCKKYECEVQKHIDAANQIIPQLTEGIDETQADLDSLRSSVSQLSKDILALRQEIADANTKLEEETTSRNEESAQNDKELSLATETIEACDDALDAVQAKHDEMNQKKTFLELSSKLKHTSQHKAQITALLQQGTGGNAEDKMMTIIQQLRDEFFTRKEAVVAKEEESVSAFDELSAALEEAIKVATESEAQKSEQKSADSASAETAMSQLENLKTSLEENTNKLETNTIKMESNKKYCSHVKKKAAEIITALEEAITFFNDPENVSKAAGAGNFLQINSGSNKRDNRILREALNSIREEIHSVLEQNAQKKKADEKQHKFCGELLESNLNQNVEQVVEKRKLESEIDSLKSDIEKNTQTIEQSNVDMKNTQKSVVQAKKERMQAMDDSALAKYNAEATIKVLEEALNILGKVSEPDAGENTTQADLEKAGKDIAEPAADTKTDSIEKGSSPVIAVIETVMKDVEQEKEDKIKEYEAEIEGATTDISDGEAAIEKLKAAIADAEDVNVKQRTLKAGKEQRLEIVGEDYENLQKWWGDDNPGNKEATEGQNCMTFLGQSADYGKLDGRETAYDSTGYAVSSFDATGGEFAERRKALAKEKKDMEDAEAAVEAALASFQKGDDSPKLL